MPDLSEALGEVLGAVMLHHGLELPSCMPFDPGYLPPVHLIAGECFHDPQDGLRIAFRIGDHNLELFEYRGEATDLYGEVFERERYVRIKPPSFLLCGWDTGDKICLADILRRDYAVRDALDKLKSTVTKRERDFEYFDGKRVRKYINGEESTLDQSDRRL